MDINQQFEQMATGAMYDDLTKELVAYRQETVIKTNQYNQSFGQAPAVRQALLKEIVGTMGENAHFEPSFRCEFGRNISLGENFYANFDCILLDGAQITIGDNVLFGPRAGIFTSNHAIDPVERVKGACYAKPVTIGDNVWFGANVTVNQGVTIGDNTVIGSGSVVTKDLPANVVAAGVPCKVIREITEQDKTDYLSSGLLH
ncbi:sugar O-acetyltransferase [Vagococcus sp. BWB3-3]|uniref:Acetyltransferase n=1 Tax=Vagococcus allomyrinae TaxID=2794353 RepID=A0A940P302_9ENTE|nr:sugar O-acetyltransferase [Vagococcus allomyrinae]MBP1040549.1 sugar O-acetyltransferase [Vagococcus allomyrinae]